MQLKSVIHTHFTRGRYLSFDEMVEMCENIINNGITIDDKHNEKLKIETSS